MHSAVCSGQGSGSAKCWPELDNDRRLNYPATWNSSLEMTMFCVEKGANAKKGI
jgi:hypothetical protein